MKKRLLSTLMVCTLTLGTVALPAIVSADDYDNKIEQQNKKIKELTNKESAASAQLAEVKNNIAVIRAEAEELQAKQVTLGKEVTQLNSDIEDLSVQIEKRDDTIKKQARSVQVNGKASNYLDAVLNAESVSEAVGRVMSATKLVNANNNLMKQQEADKKEVEVKKSETEVKLEKLNKNAAILEQKKGALQDQELQQTILVNEIAAEREGEEGKKAEFIQAKEQAEKERAAEQARLAEARRVQQEAARTQAATNDNSGNGVINGPATAGDTNTGGGNANVVTPNNPTPAPNNPVQNNPVPAPTPAPTPAPAPNASGSAIIAEANKHLGKPYVWGAKGPNSFDCSGFTRYVFLQVTGRDIGGYTVPQESAGVQIPLSQAQPGDLLFWGGRGGTSHVAISTGGTGYIHAPAPGQTVSHGSFAWFAPSFAVRVL